MTGGSNNHETTSEEANAVATDFIGEGIVSTVANTSGVAPATGGFAVNAQGTPDMTVAVSSGVAYVTGTPTSQNSQQFRVKNSASENVTISANSSGSTKYDWVYISLNATNLNTPNTAGDNVATLTTSRSSSASTDDGTPPTYGLAIAVVTVANGETAITNGMIRDVRVQCGVSAGATTATSTWTDTGYAPGTVTYNGNRSYQCVFSNTDLTGFLSNGMRLKLTRTTAPPTQCADLEAGSTQYFNKSSPNGMAGITSVFTAMGWMKLESYVQMGVISRIDSNDGWGLRINADGTVRVDGRTTSAGADSAISYQSVPLNKWVHVAATFQISSSANTKIYIDGVEVPSAFTNGADGAIGVPAVNLEVGALTGANFFDGKLAQVAVFDAVLSAATIRSYASQGLSGSETNLVSAYSLSNSLNDLSANANNLTAQGGALATNVDSPMNATEYGIITANSFSTNTTLTVQVPEGYAIPTSGGVSAVAYSTQKVPYGFPSQSGKWDIETLSCDNNTGYTSGSRVLGLDTSIPIGEWMVQTKALLQVIRASGTGSNSYFGLSTSTSTITVLNSTTFDAGSASAQPYNNGAMPTQPVPLSLTAATTYYSTIVGTFTTYSTLGLITSGLHRTVAELAYI